MLRAAAALLAVILIPQAAPEPQPSDPPPLDVFVAAASSDGDVADPALDTLAAAWKDDYAAMILDLVRLMRPSRRGGDTTVDPGFADDPSAPGAGFPDPPAAGGFDPGSPVRRRLVRFLERQTRQSFGDDLNRWREWIWQRPYDPHPDYAEFKGIVYAQIDPRMRVFFPRGVRSRVRLDEIDWGGVGVNGIPPLVFPETIPAAEAGYLKDSHLVFGVVVNGEARAYPKRILAWHELATDRVGGVELTIVYCTLCGTVIPWESEVAGRVLRFGTSGLLYRSNKLMFDETTGSLWSSLEGEPVVGPLVGMGVRLAMQPVETTTWGEWKRAHPQTRVLSLETGFRRDYSEGAAYRDYFSHDRLMFQVSRKDTRLRNKAEVLALRVPSAEPGAPEVAVAIDVRLLKKEPVFEFSAGGHSYVVLTSRRGGNRVYRAGIDPANPDEAARVPAHRAFWFGWYAQFPDTMLIK